MRFESNLRVGGDPLVKVPRYRLRTPDATASSFLQKITPAFLDSKEISSYHRP